MSSPRIWTREDLERLYQSAELEPFEDAIREDLAEHEQLAVEPEQPPKRRRTRRRRPFSDPIDRRP